ncbi:acyltransferase domain-containing protein [Rhizobium sp. BK376]|uniref:acyltransferase domain-containing protein n=1 Tax=Rhizobium sp. BK376 TaxID=2512149 RepID=UPI00104C012E|nr:acyltransferase domain-containing protein [Rhizobium sp. BK376]TCR73386.1 [acyl-carrier-protein] S-malonyltransferase [Rhizobium sp. BK376]
MSVGILCPGQNSQSASALDFLLEHPAAQPVLEAFYSVMERPIGDVVSSEDLHRNAVAQPVICAIEMASFSAIARPRITVSCIAGYSIGELAAYGCAGAIGTADVIRLAALRAELMDRAWAAPSGMMAVRGVSERALESICRQNDTYIAICNGVDRFVIGGGIDSLGDVARTVQTMGARTTSLPIAIASHTPLMTNAVAPFRRALEQVTFHAPAFPILSGIDGSWVRTKAEASEKLAKQLNTRIDWMTCLSSLKERGCKVLLELLPGTDLAAIAREQQPDIKSRSFGDFRSVEGAAAWFIRASQ